MELLHITVQVICAFQDWRFMHTNDIVRKSRTRVFLSLVELKYVSLQMLQDVLLAIIDGPPFRDSFSIAECR